MSYLHYLITYLLNISGVGGRLYEAAGPEGRRGAEGVRMERSGRYAAGRERRSVRLILI